MALVWSKRYSGVIRPYDETWHSNPGDGILCLAGSRRDGKVYIQRMQFPFSDSSVIHPSLLGNLPVPAPRSTPHTRPSPSPACASIFVARHFLLQRSRPVAFVARHALVFFHLHRQKLGLAGTARTKIATPLVWNSHCRLFPIVLCHDVAVRWSSGANRRRLRGH